MAVLNRLNLSLSLCVMLTTSAMAQISASHYVFISDTKHTVAHQSMVFCGTNPNSTGGSIHYDQSGAKELPQKITGSNEPCPWTSDYDLLTNQFLNVPWHLIADVPCLKQQTEYVTWNESIGDETFQNGLTLTNYVRSRDWVDSAIAWDETEDYGTLPHEH